MQKTKKQKSNFENYKFRASQLGRLMVNPRSKKETLSETTKEYLREVWIEETYGRVRELDNKYLDKGNFAEEDSLTLATNQLGRLLIKNTKRYENEYVTGTPDIVTENGVIDIKTCWNIWTFAKADDRNKDYYWQLQTYMWLTGTESAELVYTLVDTPPHLIADEKSRRAYKLGIINDPVALAEMEAEVEREMTFSDIDESERIKVFKFQAEKGGSVPLMQRVGESRKFLAEIQGLSNINEALQ